MDFKNMTSSEITELVNSKRLNLSELPREDLEVIYDIEVAELYEYPNHSMDLMKMCAEELSHYCMEDECFAASVEKNITLDEISNIYEKRVSRTTKEDGTKTRKRKNSEDHLDEASRSTGKKRFDGRRWAVSILALISVMIITAVITVAYGESIEDIFYLLKEKVLYEEGNKSYIKTETFQTYDSFVDFISNEDIGDILLPYNISDEMVIKNIVFADFGDYDDILLLFDYKGEKQQITIKTSYTPEYDFSDKTLRIGNFDVYSYKYDEVYQGDFCHNGNLYTITCSSYEILETILFNLEVK